MGKTGDIKNVVKNAESAIKVYRKCKLPNTKIVAGQLAPGKALRPKCDLFACSFRNPI